MISPAFSTYSPSVINTGARIYVSIPMGNTGTALAPNVWITGAVLGSARRLSPAVVRLSVGDLEVGNNFNVNLIFDGAGLVVGTRYLLTIRGTYASGGGTLGIALNRPILIPAVSALPILQLNAAGAVEVGVNSWFYTLTNNEAPGSSLYIATFSLDIAAPITVTGSPPGWIPQTDSSTYVGWYADDSAGAPYPNQIAPGSSLSGFQISSAATLSQSTAFILTSWDHQLDRPGRLFSDYISAPSLT